MLSTNKGVLADENADVISVTRKRQNQESFESGTPLESNGKKSQVQPFSSVNNPLSSADSEKQADDRQEFVPYSEKLSSSRLEERMSRLEKALMNLTEMIDEMNTNITESQISITQVVDELLEERTKVSQLDKTAKELFTLNDQLAQENEQYRQEVINLRNLLKEYEIISQCMKQEK